MIYEIMTNSHVESAPPLLVLHFVLNKIGAVLCGLVARLVVSSVTLCVLVQEDLRLYSFQSLGQVHVLHFGIFYLFQLLAELFGQDASLVVRLNVLLGPGNPESEATAKHDHWMDGWGDYTMKVSLYMALCLSSQLTDTQEYANAHKDNVPVAKVQIRRLHSLVQPRPVFYLELRQQKIHSTTGTEFKLKSPGCVHVLLRLKQVTD